MKSNQKGHCESRGTEAQILFPIIEKQEIWSLFFVSLHCKCLSVGYDGSKGQKSSGKKYHFSEKSSA